jgi:DNA 3'-phosphatase
MWTRKETVDYFLPKTDTLKKVKLYLIDLDNTLITRSNGKNPIYFDTDVDNWTFIGDVPFILDELYYQGWEIAIVTNQKWGKGKEIIRERIEKVRSELERINGWSPYVFISYTDDEYRKPRTRFYSLFSELIMSPYKVRVSGDAIGESSENKRFQWGSADFDFYRNVKNINENTEFIAPDILIPSNFSSLVDKVIYKGYKLIVMMGTPGSRKSSFAREVVRRDASFVHLEKDVISKDDKIMRMARDKLSEGKGVIIDATNSNVEKRSLWLSLINKEDSVIVFSILDGRPWNEEREGKKKVSSVVYNIYTKNFTYPTEEEGCDRVYKLY